MLGDSGWGRVKGSVLAWGTGALSVFHRHNFLYFFFIIFWGGLFIHFILLIFLLFLFADRIRMINKLINGILNTDRFRSNLDDIYFIYMFSDSVKEKQTLPPTSPSAVIMHAEHVTSYDNCTRVSIEESQSNNKFTGN